MPSYLESTADFAAKGVKGIYVVTVNDMFVVKAWKKDILKDLGSDAQSGSLKVDFSAFLVRCLHLLDYLSRQTALAGHLKRIGRGGM